LIGILATVAVLVGAPEGSGTASTQAMIYEAAFAPLRKSERSYGRLGPVGPFYPQVAVDARKSGEAMLECRAGQSGALERCKVISETPSGFNFGVAARFMADRKRIAAEGPPPGDTIRVHVPFILGAPAIVEH
jgi:hypothetical protein